MYSTRSRVGEVHRCCLNDEACVCSYPASNLPQVIYAHLARYLLRYELDCNTMPHDNFHGVLKPSASAIVNVGAKSCHRETNSPKTPRSAKLRYQQHRVCVLPGYALGAPDIDRSQVLIVAKVALHMPRITMLFAETWMTAFFALRSHIAVSLIRVGKRSPQQSPTVCSAGFECVAVVAWGTGLRARRVPLVSGVSMPPLALDECMSAWYILHAPDIRSFLH